MKLVMKRLKTTKQNVTEVQLQETSHDKLHEYNDSKDSYSYHWTPTVTEGHTHTH